MGVKYIIGILLIIHVFRAIKTQQLFYTSNYLSRSQNVINSIFSWLIPLFWGLIVRFVIRKPEIKVMTKDNRRRSNSGGDPSGYPESDSYSGGGSDGGGEGF